MKNEKKELLTPIRNCGGYGTKKSVMNKYLAASSNKSWPQTVVEP